VIARVRQSDLLHHGAIVFGGVVAANAFNYLYYMLVGRVAGVVVYGEVTALASALLVLGAPANVGQLIVAKLAADLDAAGNRAALRRLADVVTLVTALAGVLVVLIAVVARTPIAAFFKLSDAAPVVATAFALAAFFVTYVQRGILQGAHLFGQFSASLALEAIARVALGVSLVVGWGATGALVGSAVGIVLAAGYNLLVFRRRFGPERARVPLDRSTLMRVVTGVGLGQCTLTVLTFYDVPLVKHVFDARSAGLYAAAALVGRAVIAASLFIPTIVLPKATARVAGGRSALPLLVGAVGLAAALVAFAALCGFVAPRFVVTLVAGRAFGAAAPLVLPYVLASGALSIATVIAAYNFGLHQYAFVPAMFVAACIEIVTLSLWHPSLQAVVGVLLAGHTLVLLASLYGTAIPVLHRGANVTGWPARPSSGPG